MTYIRNLNVHSFIHSFILSVLLPLSLQAQLCRNTTIDAKVKTITALPTISIITKNALNAICSDAPRFPDSDFNKFLDALRSYSTSEVNDFFTKYGSNTADLSDIVKDLSLLDMWRLTPYVTKVLVLKAYKTIPTVLAAHIHVREASTDKDIKGCHNINTWNNPTVVRKVNLGATIPIGLPLTDSRVPEVVVLSEVAHPTVPSIKLVTYKTPAADTRSLTTGALKSKVYDKTLLDPAFWTDAKLIKAVKEAFNNAIQLGSTTATSSASVKFTGSTSDGYIIDGYYLPAIPTITTFYFK